MPQDPPEASGVRAFCFSLRGRPLRPGARLADGASLLVAVGVPCGDHRVASLLTPIAHIRSARRFLARRNVSVPCVYLGLLGQAEAVTDQAHGCQREDPVIKSISLPGQVSGSVQAFPANAPTLVGGYPSSRFLPSQSVFDKLLCRREDFRVIRLRSQ